MTVIYNNLNGGLSRRLSETVFAGSHDASITGGNPSAQTQTHNIGEQARAGVRLFDLRILARSGSNQELVGYHGVKGPVVGFGKHQDKHFGRKKFTRNRMLAGCFGESLHDMLTQAKQFLSTDGASEFLIFKFDKCTNYALIAEYCIKVLGDNIYTDNGIEFNKLQLSDLKGRVACVFDKDGVDEINKTTQWDHSSGILGFRNLFSKKGGAKAYEPQFKGLQYQGKGGTDKKNTKQLKGNGAKDYGTRISENERKQRKRLAQMASISEQYAPNVLGMMYWTSTGLNESIKDRNDAMWNDTGVKKMGELWNECLAQGIETQMAQKRVKILNLGDGPRIKAFFPNFVMVDFADLDKCEAIRSLNNARDDKLARAYLDWAG